MNKIIQKGIGCAVIIFSGNAFYKKIVKIKKGEKWETLFNNRSKYSIFLPPTYTGGRKYSIDESFFAVIDTPEKAYILGVIGADGSLRTEVNKRNYQLEITSSFSDIHWLYKIRALMGSNHKIYFHWNKVHGTYNLSLSILKKSIYYDLINKGMIPGRLKSHALKFPATEFDIGEQKYAVFSRDLNFPLSDDTLKSLFNPSPREKMEFEKQIKNYSKSITILKDAWDSDIAAEDTVPTHLIPDYIRGSFDGDGTIIGNSEKQSFGFSGTKFLLSTIERLLHGFLKMSQKNIYQPPRDSKKTSGAISSEIGKKTFAMINYSALSDFKKFAKFLYSNKPSMFLPEKYQKFKQILPSIPNLDQTYNLALIHEILFDILKFLLIEIEKNSSIVDHGKITLKFLLNISYFDKKKEYYGDFLDFLEYLWQNMSMIAENDEIIADEDFRKDFRYEYLNFYRYYLAKGTKIRIKFDNATYFAPEKTTGILLSILRSSEGKKQYVEKIGKFRQLLEMLDFLKGVLKRNQF
ncbi:hypothetical protein NEF87_001047 [Candidatus Lokiarchaeum ossiferum]|uniref:DOD-type homing endonuclease domain-containing protein n=1 Tax=Candidatus Lokiarchaeum ossiferum TaxID=2951803 RepID=A0ABY6HMN3_9ARCH|nr:hypothetical protein NEF87_001047 [Candidatus Lokiarchaeum sp. B-35]